MIITTFLIALASVGQSPAPILGKTSSGIAYDIQGAGPAVVLITGSNLDRRMWAADVDSLKQRFTVIRYDLRAHGQSESPTATFDHVEDLLALLDHLGLDRVSLVGLSAGSTIAIDAALRAPRRIARMVLAAPAVGGHVPKSRPAFFTDLIAAIQSHDFAKAREVLLASPLFDVPDASRALVRTMVTENDRLWTVPREWMQRPAAPAVTRLSEVKTPTLVLIGDRDLDSQREQADLLAQRLPAASLVVIPGGGHLLNLTSPDTFRRAVSDFLDASRR